MGTTVAIGAACTFPNADWLLSLIALISNAAVTVIAACEGFLRPKDFWIQKTDTWMALQNLDANIKYAIARSGGRLTEEDVDVFFVMFDDIVMAEHQIRKSAPKRAYKRATIDFE